MQTTYVTPIRSFNGITINKFYKVIPDDTSIDCYTIINNDGWEVKIAHGNVKKLPINEIIDIVHSDTSTLKQSRIEINNKIQELESLLEELLTEQTRLNKEVTYGSRWKHKSGDEYIVVRVDYDLYSLIKLSDGNRWTKPSIEVQGVFGDAVDLFTKVLD